MALSRYTFSSKIGGRKTTVSSSSACYIIYGAVESRSLQYTTKILQEGERLDQIASDVYGDGSLWWVIAAASGIGWAPQVPPGTLLRIPTNVGDVFGLLI